MSNNAVPQYGADGGDAVTQDVTDASGATIGGPTVVAVAGSTRSAPAEGVDLRWILPRDMRDTVCSPIIRTSKLVPMHPSERGCISITYAERGHSRHTADRGGKCFADA